MIELITLIKNISFGVLLGLIYGSVSNFKFRKIFNTNNPENKNPKNKKFLFKLVLILAFVNIVTIGAIVFLIFKKTGYNLDELITVGLSFMASYWYYTIKKAK